jgi:SAM-dependent methyltransferase
MSGYVSDVAYTLGFYRELAPTFLNFSCLSSGVEGPSVDRALRYCELGCGRGYGTTLLAAANPEIEFVGIDFNPSHIAEARSLAARANIRNVTFHELSFADAAEAQSADLINFDIAALHGVYTWVEPDVRRDIIQFLRLKLLSGGIAFASYNCMPGWASVTPLQRVLMEVDSRSSRSSIAVLNEGLTLLGKLVDQPSALTTQNPGLKARVEKMTKQDRNYLAHEFLNSGWEPLYVTDVMNDFSEAKLTYVGSASLPENRTDLCVPLHFRSLIAESPDVAIRELLKDYVVNKQFRRDIYIKGPQALSSREQLQRFKKMTFAPGGAEGTIEKIQLPAGEAAIKSADMKILASLMSEGPTTGADMMAAAEKLGYKTSEAIMIITLLVHADVIAPAKPTYATIDKAASARLNTTLIGMAIKSDTHRFLSSPVLGSAVATSFVDRVAAYAIVNSKSAETMNDVELAKFAFDTLAESGQLFRRNGTAMNANEENIGQIAKVIGEFRINRKQRWRTLGLLKGI